MVENAYVSLVGLSRRKDWVLEESWAWGTVGGWTTFALALTLALEDWAWLCFFLEKKDILRDVIAKRDGMAENNSNLTKQMSACLSRWSRQFLYSFFSQHYKLIHVWSCLLLSYFIP